MSDQRPTREASDPLDALGSLAEPTRRVVYDFVVASGGWVSRDQAADALSLERGTVVHHLDRLAADGLLDVNYQRLSGRRGPGAGRPAKLYRRSRRELEVSLPPRDYELAGRLLAAAAERSKDDGVDITTAIEDVARARGLRLADEVRARLSATAGRGATRRRRAVLRVLEDHGFEPHVGPDGAIELRNCPFHQLAQAHTDLICGMNLCLLDAAIDGVGDTGFVARLEPGDGHCCVRLHPAR